MQFICTQNGATRLRPEWQPLLRVLPRLGQVRGITANRHAILRTDGGYPEYQQFGCRGLFTGDALDVRLCLPLWSAAFAVAARRPGDCALERSLHFYDNSGAAVHRILLTKHSSIETFEEILEEFTDRDQSPVRTIAAVLKAPAAVASPLCGLHKEMLLAEWAKLKDTLSFNALLREYGVTRQDAFRIAEGRFTRRVALRAVRPLLGRIAFEGLPVVACVGNVACEQVHRGALTIHDRSAVLQLNESGISAAWVVEIPTKVGRIELLELHDADGRGIVSISGARTEAGPQHPAWHETLLLRSPALCEESQARETCAH